MLSSHGFCLRRGVPCLHLVLILHSFPSLIPGKEQQGGNCLSSPRTAGGRKLWQAPASSPSGIPGGAVPCSLSLARPLLDALPSTCHLLVCSLKIGTAPVRAQTGPSASGGDPKSGRKICLKGESRENVDPTLSNGSWRHLQQCSCPTGKACVRQLCAQE